MNNTNTILIFGGAGSLGTALVTRYLPQGHRIVVASRDEAKHWELKNRFLHSHSSLVKNLSTEICDVRDKERVLQVILKTKPTVVIIAQALKQVDACEANPEECIKTNILGVQNIIHSIESSNRMGWCVSSACFVSTDKACSPINVYGMSKSIAEKLIINASESSQTRYVVTRYGNVLSSKGSIIPLFMKQAIDPSCQHFTVTDVRMTRFLMTLDESVDLIDNALAWGSTGTIWIPRVEAMLISDLADYFSVKYHKPVKVVGIRPGEKIHESLVSAEEMRMTSESNGCYVIWKTPQNSNPTETPYCSSLFVLDKDSLFRKMDAFLPLEVRCS
jgi:FlaA1/EpsC-like NDP-sugar epimerase